MEQKGFKKPSVKPINTENDALMVSEGLRLPIRSTRDQSVWSKTPAEKAALKKQHKIKTVSSSCPPDPMVGAPQKLVVTLEKGVNVSFTCCRSEIGAYLRKVKKDGIVKYSFAGITYKAGQFPVKLGLNMRVA